MRFLPPCILVGSVIILTLINLLPNTAYKGVAHPVESEFVRVYTTQNLTGDPEVPITRLDENILSANTGQKVVVYLRSDYQGKELWNQPRSTLWTLGVATLLYCSASVLKRRVLIGR